jgi:anti-anti-sigma factor
MEFLVCVRLVRQYEWSFGIYEQKLKRPRAAAGIGGISCPVDPAHSWRQTAGSAAVLKPGSAMSPLSLFLADEAAYVEASAPDPGRLQGGSEVKELKWSVSWPFFASTHGEGGPGKNTAELCREGSRPFLRLCGEFDVATAWTVRAALDEACQDASGEVLVDLSRAGFFDAVTIGIFVQANERLHKAGGRLTLLGLSEHQETVLRICSLEHLLAVAVSRPPSASSAPSG